MYFMSDELKFTDKNLFSLGDIFLGPPLLVK